MGNSVLRGGALLVVLLTAFCIALPGLAAAPDPTATQASDGGWLLSFGRDAPEGPPTNVLVDERADRVYAATFDGWLLGYDRRLLERTAVAKADHGVSSLALDAAAGRLYVVGVRYQDRSTEASDVLAVDGVFVQIGLVPNSGVAKDLVTINRMGEIVIDERCRTSKAGIYAAGDVSSVPFKQIVIAMGEGAKAALTAFEDRIRAA